jgi:type IV pilus assembly protein PilP
MTIRFLGMCFVALTLSACGQSSSHQDLKGFIKTVKARPAGKIDKIPDFPSYESFIYTAASQRSPFDRPVDVQARVFAQTSTNVRPDLNRVKGPLELIDFGALSMVGAIRWGQELFALIEDGDGEVHHVLPGQFLGKNHGKIVLIDNTKIEVVEIVSNGLDGWVERPRVMALVEKD